MTRRMVGKCLNYFRTKIQIHENEEKPNIDVCSDMFSNNDVHSEIFSNNDVHSEIFSNNDVISEIFFWFFKVIFFLSMLALSFPCDISGCDFLLHFQQ